MAGILVSAAAAVSAASRRSDVHCRTSRVGACAIHGKIAQVRRCVRLLLATVALAVAPGCLSTPDPAGGGDDDDAPDLDAAIDSPPAARCRTDTHPAPRAWPPSGIEVRAALVADVDGDDVGDLVVSAAPFNPGAAGPSAVYVLYGPVSPTAPQFHAELDLDNDSFDAEVQPSAMSLDDVDGDGCLDLTVAGPPTFSNTASRVAVWQHSRTATPWTGTAVRANLAFTPEGAGPVMVQWAQLSLSPQYDLVVADLYNVEIISNSSLGSLGASLLVERPQQCNNWDNINALALQPRDNGRDRLLVFGHYRLNTVDIEDNGDVVVTPQCEMQQVPITRGSARVDLDGSNPLDLISGAAGTLGAHLIDGTAPVVSPMTGTPACIDTPRGTDNYIEGFAAGDLGGTSAPDVLIIDHDDEGTVGSYACLVNGIAADGTSVTANGADEMMVTPNRLRTLAVGDVDGNGVRGWLFEDDGTIHCVRRSPGVNALEGC
jgi:hypothetical protein